MVQFLKVVILKQTKAVQQVAVHPIGVAAAVETAEKLKMLVLVDKHTVLAAVAVSIQHPLTQVLVVLVLLVLFM
tara:strand:- start:43 stop:264 length:222 start_codon:yes stop_codon:yes gene_type:complete